jgi:hypothetical protein
MRIQDIALAWANRLPVPGLTRDELGSKNPKLVEDLVDLWNVSFFIPRGIELVLYRGRERRTGQHAGTLDRDAPDFDESEDDLSLTESEEASENSDSDYGAGRYGSHGRTNAQDALSEVFELGRQRRAAAKVERKRRRQERNRRRRERRKNKKYWLSLTYIPIAESGGAGYVNPKIPGGYPTAGGGYGVRGGAGSY